LYDLALTKVLANSGPFMQNSQVRYTITVSNQGGINATNVVVTDRPETGLILTSMVPQSGVTNNNNGTFTIASIPVGQSVSFEVIYTISATFQGTSLTNEAEITQDDPFDDVDSTPNNDVPTEDDQDDVTIPVQQTYDLALTKVVTSAGPYSQSSTVTYTITVTNEGSLNAAGIVVTDRPETGLSLVSMVPQAGVTNNGNGTFTIASLAQGASISFVVNYQIGATFQGTSLTNEAEITTDNGDDVDSTPNNDVPTEDDQDDVTIPVQQTYDLALTKVVTSAGPYSQSSTVTYTITVTNEGSLNAAGIVVTDRPEAGLSLVSMVPQAGVTNNGNGTFTIASLAQGASISFVVNYQIGATFQGTSLTNEAEITTDNGDDVDSTPNNDVPTEDDQDDVTIPVQQTYDLALTKVVTSAGPYSQSSTVTYTITVTNEGSLNAAGIVVTDRPEAGLSLVSMVPQAGVTNNGDGTFSIASLAQGASISFVVNYQIGATFQGTSLTNEAEITTDNGDDVDSTPNNDVPTEDDQDDVTIPVQQTYDLALTKVVTSAGPYSQSSTVTYTITVTNEGSLNAAGIVVTDRPEAGLSLVSMVPQAGVTNNGNGTFTIASLAQGASISFVVNYQIGATFQGTSLNNEAEITTDNGDDVDSTPNNDVPTEDDQDDVTIPVQQTYDLALTKVVTSAGPYSQRQHRDLHDHGDERGQPQRGRYCGNRSSGNRFELGEHGTAGRCDEQRQRHVHHREPGTRCEHQLCSELPDRRDVPGHEPEQRSGDHHG
jgi:uncharacterized repeat protein (TIGR01451 family)